MRRDLLASQFEVLEEPSEALVENIDDSPDRAGPRLTHAPLNPRISEASSSGVFIRSDPPL
jgi:hypothetical protein